ncbi:MAG TPA: hypothetical protein VFH58_04085, partial [Acidimicrobiales bacterium]|nr:hypothetical protein [Acidimicrobiales bacterium]
SASPTTVPTTVLTPVDTDPPPPRLTPRPARKPAPPASTTATKVPPRPGPPSYEPILAFGDSVMLAATPELNAAFGPAITVDAEVGRHVNTALTRLQQYRTSGALARYRTVVVDLGTNGAFTPGQFAQMSAILAGVPRVVVYDVHANRSWTAADNATIIQGVAAHHPQMTLVDWNTPAATVPGLLYSDGIHPNAAGSAVYTRLLQQALAGH